MSYIRIGNEQRSLGDADEQWISEQLRRRRADGASTCVQVSLKTSYIDILLSTPQCARTGGGRQATAQEMELFELWAKRGLNDHNFNAGNVMAFLNQVRRIL